MQKITEHFSTIRVLLNTRKRLNQRKLDDAMKSIDELLNKLLDATEMRENK